MVQEQYQIAKEKLDHAAILLEMAGIDSWLVLTREGSDPSMPLLFGIRSFHTAAIFINRDGRHKVISTVSDKGNYEGTGLFSEVIPYYASLDEVFVQELAKLAPQKLALNISAHDHLCDGLTLGLYLWLEDLLGKERLQAIEVSSEAILKELRSVKSPTEIACIQQAVDYTIEIYEEVFSQIVCGMTEIEIGELFVEGMKKRSLSNGLGNPHDPPLVCTVRNGLAHRKPGAHKTIPGDIVIIDFSLKYKDYVSDIARTAYLLKPGETEAPEDIRRAFQTAIEAITTAIDFIRPGVKGYEVDAAARQVIEMAGYPTIRHSTGHQVGRETHDGGTTLGPRRTPPRPAVEGIVQVGEIYAIEPTVIQDDGLPCILVEENVLITDQGARILSKRQTELVTIASES
ncbi:M24 family metallopeptidase [Brevibacillus reuszeri]|uniref:M24 family metallopeptidase n=1 Tax=Brevibacillus reuszeri TaxID=54915 RepID=UPI00289EB37C|nr:Xaa-Pro peptidase family protein [Brevibacillus reuszeri]